MTESAGSTKPVAVIVLGADTVLSAQPATPVQLWHACLAVGYNLAVPATWGDELIAAEALRALSTHPETVAVMCSCPMVARALAEACANVAPHLVSLVAPPVAAARYLRRVYGDRRVHITYAGACPAAGDSAIDSWITPAELLARFAASQVVLAAQPEFFESILPPDRRRHLSQPGGLPTAERAGAIARPRRIHAVNDGDHLRSLERYLASGVRTLLDVAPTVGCSCSGMVPGMAASAARAAVTALEPPHSVGPVMADPGGLGLIRRVPPSQPKREIEAPPGGSAATEPREVAAAEERRPGPAATRRPTHSPLSWNLRERAHPQPTIGARPGAGAPVVSRGTSSATWAHLPRAAATPVETPSPRPDATAAPVAPHEVETVGAEPFQEAVDHSVSRSAALEVDEVASAPAGAPTESSEQDAALPAPGLARRESLPRATPPGGYWFIAPPGVGEVAPDIEVQRQRPSREFPVMVEAPPAAEPPLSAATLPEGPLPSSAEEMPNDSSAAVALPENPPPFTSVTDPDAPTAVAPRSVETTLLSIGTGVVMAAAVLLLGRSPFDRR